MIEETRGPGMDHALYRYAALNERPHLAWPDGARVALLVTLYLEHWEAVPAEGTRRDQRFVGDFGSYSPDWRSYSVREYGMRVGIFRVLEVLDRYQLPITVALGSEAARRYPPLVQEVTRRNWEVAAHGFSSTRILHSKLSEEEERAAIAEAIDTVTTATGKRPTGWISQDYAESQRTPALVAKAGLDWLMDWPNDDQPYWINPKKPIVSIPNQMEWDDGQLLWLRRIATPRYPTLVREAFETLWDEGAASGRLLQLGIHPWLFGQAHRIRYLDAALAALAGRRQVWRTTAGEVARWYKANGPAPAFG